jgi:hypothetical protein
MEKTGRTTLATSPSRSTCSSTRRLLSKCGMPVSRSAPPTELSTRRGTPASRTASTRATPCSVSCSAPPGPKGVVMTKAASAPSKAARRLAGSLASPRTTSTPWRASACPPRDPGSRVSPRTRAPAASSARTVAPPCWPVAPTTANSRPSPLVMASSSGRGRALPRPWSCSGARANGRRGSGPPPRRSRSGDATVDVPDLAVDPAGSADPGERPRGRPAATVRAPSTPFR